MAPAQEFVADTSVPVEKSTAAAVPLPTEQPAFNAPPPPAEAIQVKAVKTEIFRPPAQNADEAMGKQSNPPQATAPRKAKRPKKKKRMLLVKHG